MLLLLQLYNAQKLHTKKKRDNKILSLTNTSPQHFLFSCSKRALLLSFYCFVKNFPLRHALTHKTTCTGKTG